MLFVAACLTLFTIGSRHGARDFFHTTAVWQERLTKAMRDANVAYELEIYPAKHGWVPSDTPMHDPACAEKHWQTLEALFARTLR